MTSLACFDFATMLAQTLEKLMERHRDDMRKEKEENRIEKARRIRTEKAVKDSYTNVEQVYYESIV